MTDPTDWLLDADADPAIRWQALRDLGSADPAAVAAERARIATVGWGARLLKAEDADGQWEGGACFPSSDRGRRSDLEGPGQPWTSTLPSLQLLWQFGLDPADGAARRSVALVREHCRWEYDGEPFFDGEVEACINGRTVAIGSYFGEPMRPLVDRLLGEQLEDGGWNCETENGSLRSSFHSTICVLEGLLEFERAGADIDGVAEARRRGEEYLLERHLWRRRSTGEPVDPDFALSSFPTWWCYDVLRGLDHLRATGAAPDPRCGEAVALIEAVRGEDGRWPLQNPHPGRMHFTLEGGEGEPSRWNTLRALRVLQWWEQAASR